MLLPLLLGPEYFFAFGFGNMWAEISLYLSPDQAGGLESRNLHPVGRVGGSLGGSSGMGGEQVDSE